MAPPELRSLFRADSEGLRAQEVFADRYGEWEAAKQSLISHMSRVRAPEFDVSDFGATRENVLVMYGVGGIGKSELTKRLEDHLSGENASEHWSHVPGDMGRILPLRIDFARQSGMDFEGLILAMRLAAGRLGRPMPAFDIALRHYWDVNHPGEPLDGYLRKNSFLRRLASIASIPDQIQSAVDDIVAHLQLPTLAGSATTTAIRAIVGALREKRNVIRALARCERLADLLEADQDIETMSYFPHLLAWDLAQIPAPQGASLVVLMDTFEEVSNPRNRDLERLVQRVVWLMPNALFIITGRNRLQWDNEELEGELDWTGPTRWPLLAAGASGEPRQHLVGYLSEEDREEYLRRRLVRRGWAVIPPDVRREIGSRSHGLPLYLDLAVMRFRDLYERNKTAPGPEEFRRDFPALVARIVRDLTPGERVVLRTVCLLDSFSVELATAAAGMPREADALNLVASPLVTREPQTAWPYRLHDLIRSVVREADSTTEDRWSPKDWHNAAERALHALGEQMPSAGEKGSRARLMSCLTQGLRLAREYDLPLGWLVEAAWSYVAQSIWEPVEIPVAPQGVSTSASAAASLAVALRAIAGRQRAHRAQTVRDLTVILNDGSLPAGGIDLVRYYLAECQRHLGDYTSSAGNMRAVAAGSSPMANDAARGLAYIARHSGDFPAALEATQALPHNTRYHRALGHIWWLHGKMSLACSEYGVARDLALVDANQGQAALAQASLTLASAFENRALAQQQIQRADELLQGVRLSWAETHVRIARLVRDAGADPSTPGRAAEIAHQAMEAGLGSSLAYVRLALCFHYAIRHETDELLAARSELGRSAAAGEYAYLLEISHFLDGTEDPADMRTRWIEGGAAAANRWRRIVEERRSTLGP